MARKALCVGINDYPGTSSDLAGCVNDAKDWKDALESRGYGVSLLLDSQAKRAAIVNSLNAMIQESTSGDSLVFTFSGHGSWLADDDGDELDERDELLCPHDVAQGQYLLDDDLADIFALKPRGVRLYFIADSCHSGTVTRFLPPLTPADLERANRPRFLPPSSFVKDPVQLSRLRSLAQTPSASRPRYPALLAAGCRDFEYSYDAWFNDRPNGAFTYVAIQALSSSPVTPRMWMNEIRRRLPTSAHPQTPSLFGSRSAKSGSMF